LNLNSLINLQIVENKNKTFSVIENFFKAINKKDPKLLAKSLDP